MVTKMNEIKFDTEFRSAMVHLAVSSYENHLIIARRMIEAGDDVNQEIEAHEQLPALHAAALRGNMAVIRLLLEYNADITLKARNYFKRTALHCAAESRGADHYEICKLLLENGASCEERDQFGCTPFILATWYKNLKVAQLLLDHGANSKTVDDNGETALHYAAMAGDIDLIRLALEQGINIESSTNSDYSALHYAAVHGQHKACEFLLKHGAMVSRKSTITGHTPLSLFLSECVDSSADRLVQTLHVLLDYGAQVTDKFENKSLLEIAAAEYRSESIRDVLMHHMAKMKCFNLKADEHDLETIESEECYKKFYQKHLQEMEAEVEMMRKTKFYNNLPISILLRSRKVISGYARNEELVYALSNEAYDSQFPILFSSLKKRVYAEVEKLRLRRPALNSLNNIFKFNDPFHPVIQEIISFLSEEDLKYLGV